MPIIGYKNNRKEETVNNRIDNPDIVKQTPLSSINQEIPNTAIDFSKLRTIIGTGGARINFFPSTNVGFSALNVSGAEIFKILIDGADVGDVLFGDVASGNYVQWDDSTNTLNVFGTLTATSGTIGGWTINATTITGGNVTLDSAGNIRFGKTGFSDTVNAGLIMGLNGATPTFYLGTALDASYIKISGGVYDMVGTVSSRSTATLAGAINSSGNLINDIINSKLDSSTKKILSDFNFGTTDYAGAVNAGNVTWNTTTGAITGGSGILIYRSGIIGVSSGVTTFSIDSATGSATFAGTLSAPTGTIGGFTLGSDYIRDNADSMGLASTVTGGDDVRFWAGATYANRATAPFRVYESGAIVATSATVNGSSISNEDRYGDGSDGDATISGTTTLTSDMFYNDLSVTGTLNTGGYRIFVKGTLSGNGTIQNNGNAGGNGGDATANAYPTVNTGGAAGTGGTAAAGNSVPSGLAGKAGGAGSNGRQTSGSATSGSNGVDGGTTNRTINTANGAAGVGGGTGSSTGGAAGTPGTTILNKIRNYTAAYLLSDFIGGVNNFNVANISGGSGGGGGGNGTSTPCDAGAGGGGGGSGSSGGIVWIAARTITFSGTIKSIGGNGGNGGNGCNAEAVGIGAGGGGGGGAGSGGNGGVIIIVTSSESVTYTTSVLGGSAGSPGTGGSGTGGQPAGTTGSTGNSGNSGVVINLIV